ncbi:MAG TPA: N,N-dimethylformamidase beta subunit family domain-containing protein [Thermoanaerobaculia bacterium]|jgi:hypothetical protein
MATRRQFLKRTALTGVGLAVAPMFSRRALAGVGPYAQAYPNRISLDPGDTLYLHVSTDMPEFRVQIYRVGSTMEWFATSDWMPGGYYQPRTGDQDFEWPDYPIRTAYDWPSGAYIAMIETRDRGGIVYSPDLSTPDGELAKALFVLRRAASSKASLLYKLATNTYHAYNHGRDRDDFGSEAGGNLHHNLREYYVDGNFVGYRVSLRRPGGGTGGDWQDGGFAATQSDPYDGRSRRNNFTHWDAKMIAWLESNRYEVDYCTDLDLHNDATGALLDPNVYRMMLSVGHDEYWSLEMREHLARFVSHGGNVAFFSGDVMSWRANFIEKESAFYVHKEAPELLTGLDHWWDQQSYPSNFHTGVGSRNAGYALGAIDPAGYIVRNTNHWVFRDTGLVDGDLVAARDRLLSYRPDGARFQRDPNTLDVRLDVDNDGNNVDRTPARFRILGSFETGVDERPIPGWEFEPREPGEAPRGATMGLHTNVGTVFTGGTTEWARVLEVDPTIEIITHNVLRNLGRSSTLLSIAHFNLDRIPELIFRHPGTGITHYWVMDGIIPSGGGSLDDNPLDPDWRFAGSGRIFAGKYASTVDLVWQNERTGEVLLWLMNGYEKIEEARIDTSEMQGWSLVGVGDLDRDGGADFIWRSPEGNSLQYWIMKEGLVVERGEMEGMDAGWRFVGIGDLNSDGTNDILWQDEATGRLLYFFLDGVKVVDRRELYPLPEKGWMAAGMGDFNDDGSDDIVFQHAETGDLMVWWMYKMDLLEERRLAAKP